MNARLLGFAMVALVPLQALAQVVCDQPRPRDLSPLLKALKDDDAMASTFDVTAGACISDSAACDAQKLKCGEQLTKTMQSQVNVDDGMWLRDMLLPFVGQNYTMTLNIARVPVAQDISCNADAATLKAAGARRRELAQKRRDIANEYPKWAQWTAALSQRCKSDQAAAATAQAQAAATAQAQATAALAAKQAEELRQENLKKAELANKDKAEAERKAKEDAAKAAEAERKRLADAELERQRKMREAQMTQAELQAEQQKRIEEEKKRQAAEEQRKLQEIENEKKRVAAAAADAKFVAEREAKKDAADKKIAELQAKEEARRAQAEKEIAEAGKVDRSDERLAGSIGAHAAGAYVSLNSTHSGALVGVMVSARYGIWMTAPADGFASGMELKVNGTFGGLIMPGNGSLFVATPELRWFFRRFGVGASFEWRHLTNTEAVVNDPDDNFALGLNLALAMLDTHDARLIATLRWMPFLNANTTFMAERVTGELEFGYKVFTGAVQAGTITLRTGTGTTIGWYAGLALGGRLRF